jgi:molybdopterin biosynthesis enzyme MoaB
MAEPPGLTAAVVTVSDSCARGEREDRSGPAVARLLQKLRFSVVAREVVPDDPVQIQTCDSS